MKTIIRLSILTMLGFMGQQSFTQKPSSAIGKSAVRLKIRGESQNYCDICPVDREVVNRLIVQDFDMKIDSTNMIFMMDKKVVLSPYSWNTSLSTVEFTFKDKPYLFTVRAMES